MKLFQSESVKGAMEDADRRHSFNIIQAILRLAAFLTEGQEQSR